jgi:hypothetical protein
MMISAVILLWPCLLAVLLLVALYALMVVPKLRPRPRPPCFGHYRNSDCVDCKPEIRISCIVKTKERL